MHMIFDESNLFYQESVKIDDEIGIEDNFANVLVDDHGLTE